MPESSARTLLDFAGELQIAHHVPGRLRLKLNAPLNSELMALAGEAKSFRIALARMAGIRSISLNPIARSCVVEYDPSTIPPVAWRGLISGETTPESEALRHQLLGAIGA